MGLSIGRGLGYTDGRETRESLAEPTMAHSDGKEPRRSPPSSAVVPSSSLQRDHQLVRLGGLCLLVLLSFNAWLTTRQIEQQSSASREHLFWVICHEGGTPESRKEAFLALVAEGNSIWTSARLEKLNLNGVDLAGTYLAGVILDGSRMVEAQLMRADLLQASLKTVDLRKASFVGAQMEEVLALRAKLDEAHFFEANLRSASLEQVHAHKAQFVKADLSDSYLYMADFTGSSFTGANLTDANLEAAIFRNTDLSLAVMDGTRLVDADFSGANWWRAQGLTQSQLDELSAKYAPDEDASAERRDDYQRWLSNQK